MAKVVKRPVRSERGVGPLEHPVRRVIGQRPVRAPQRPPERIRRPGGPRPRNSSGRAAATRTRRARREALHRPRALADHRDQLLRRDRRPCARAQQLRGPCPGRDPERDQRPVPVRGQPGEQLVEPLVGDASRDPPGHPRPVAARPLACRNGSPGRTGGSPRRSPLRTVRATRRGTRLKQAARACRPAVLIPCAGGLQVRDSTRRVRGVFECRPVSPAPRSE